jgi:hypothetical protein
MSRGSVLVAILVIAPGVAAAQRPGGMAGGGHVGGGVPRAGGGTVARMAPAAPAHFSVRLQLAAPRASGAMVRGHGIRTHRSPTNVSVVPFGPFGGTEFQDAPGLGFDFPHLAAINANRRPHFRNFGGVFPFGFNGFLLGAPTMILEEGVADTSQADERQDAEVQEVAAENARLREAVRLGRSRNRAAESDRAVRDSAPTESEPQREQEKTTEYVFVRRDGSLVFAVGYSWDKDTLRYVTLDGVRRTIKREALDLNATQEFNEQRGLSFHLG